MRIDAPVGRGGAQPAAGLSLHQPHPVQRLQCGIEGDVFLPHDLPASIAEAARGRRKEKHAPVEAVEQRGGTLAVLARIQAQPTRPFDQVGGDADGEGEDVFPRWRLCIHWLQLPGRLHRQRAFRVGVQRLVGRRRCAGRTEGDAEPQQGGKETQPLHRASKKQGFSLGS
ncbi:hypothetical protein ACFJIS_00780 [Variovorax boronicumulans]|uniref:hypothetical protein n=1 Tax=Variovorax boronicumulans TaxID=436515 RepID=UPI0036F28285